MSKSKNKKSQFFGRCKCCLNDGYVKNMWEEHIRNGRRHVYGDMLANCFGLEWQPPGGSSEQICDSCIQKLQNIIGFKRTILTSQHKLNKELNIATAIKQDSVETNPSHSEDNNQELPSPQADYLNLEIEQDSENVTENMYENVEFIEDESEADFTQSTSSFKDQSFNTQFDDEHTFKTKKRFSYGKWKNYTLEDMVKAVTSVLAREKSVLAASSIYHIPLSTLKARVKEAREDQNMEQAEILENSQDTRKLIYESNKLLRNHNTTDMLRAIKAVTAKEMTIKDAANKFNVPITLLRSRCELKKNLKPLSYTPSDLLEAIVSVKNKGMDIDEASDKYGIPRNALIRKLKWSRMKESIKAPQNQMEYAKQQKLIKELQDILAYTNALPFKSKGNRYHCAYCYEEKAMNIDGLRSHTINEHSGHRVDNACAILTPAHLNEICKVDVSNLMCTVCFTDLPSWPGVFEHLKTHNLDFEEAFKRIIPFNITDELKCALCDEACASLSYLVVHMNSHYSNYICSECGDTFLTLTRLIHHSATHETGKYPCKECGKLFSKKYRDKHIKQVHMNAIRYKCDRCAMDFKSEYTRHQHKKEFHGMTFKVISCEHCNKEFDWRPYYLKHKRIKHQTLKD